MLAVVLTLPDFHPYACALGLLVAMCLQPGLQKNLPHQLKFFRNQPFVIGMYSL